MKAWSAERKICSNPIIGNQVKFSFTWIKVGLQYKKYKLFQQTLQETNFDTLSIIVINLPVRVISLINGGQCTLTSNITNIEYT